MKNAYKMLEDLVWVLQLGISILMPLLLCMAICYWLTCRFGIGNWIYLIGIILGIGSSVVSFRDFSRMILRRKENQPPPKKAVHFNRHI